MDTKALQTLGIIVAAASCQIFQAARADTIRDYAFTGTISPSTIDVNGIFGAPGANLGGLTFTANIFFDENIGYKLDSGGGFYTYSGGGGVLNNNGPVSVPAPSPLVASSYTVNGRTKAGSSGGFAQVTNVTSDYFQLTAGGLSFTAETNGISTFPVHDAPTSVNLGCTFECPDVFSQSFTASVGGIALGPELQNLTITDVTRAPEIEPASAAAALTVLLGALAVWRGRPNNSRLWRRSR
jgi:hypothetical protein